MKLQPAQAELVWRHRKINTAILEQDLSGVHFFSEVTEEQLHLSGEFNCETQFGTSYGVYLIMDSWEIAKVEQVSDDSRQYNQRKVIAFHQLCFCSDWSDGLTDSGAPLGNKTNLCPTAQSTLLDS